MCRKHFDNEIQFLPISMQREIQYWSSLKHNSVVWLGSLSACVNNRTNIRETTIIELTVNARVTRMGTRGNSKVTIIHNCIYLPSYVLLIAPKGTGRQTKFPTCGVRSAPGRLRATITEATSNRVGPGCAGVAWPATSFLVLMLEARTCGETVAVWYSG